MPELPEVETVVRTLAPLLCGAAIVAIEKCRRDILTPSGLDLAAHLRGRHVTRVHRRAKRIIITLDNQAQFYIHLGMTGRLTMEMAEKPLQSHTHLIVAVRTAVGDFHLRFCDPRRFGGLWWLGTTPMDESDLGPEPFGLSARELAQLLNGIKRPIKSALLDQSLIAGLGNIYADESLFAAGIHPLTPACGLKIEQVRLLNGCIKRILNKAINSGGSSMRDYVDAQGNTGAYQKLHLVYARDRQPCHKCRTPIQRIVISGRSAHFCPKCQRKTALCVKAPHVHAGLRAKGKVA